MSGECICRVGDGPQEDCPVHGREHLTKDQRIKELEEALNKALCFFNPTYERPEAAKVYCECFHVLYGYYPPAYERLRPPTPGELASPENFP